MNYILSVGGPTVQKVVGNIIKKIYTYDLQSTTTWLGVRDKQDKTIFIKKPMENTKIPHLTAGK